MCLIAVAWRAHPRYELVIAANRDEFHQRPSAPAMVQDDAPEVFGGRDLQAGGSWLQLSTRRRLAAVTNVRSGARPPPAAISRGTLVADFLRSKDSAVLAALRPTTDVGPHTLLLWDGDQLWQSGNHPTAHAAPVTPGVHALSNASLDAPWPKSQALSAAMGHWIKASGDDGADDEPDTDALFVALANPQIYPDASLPSTGVPIEWERTLSAAFICGDEYGTRASTVVCIDQQGRMTFEERRFGPGGAAAGRSYWRVD